MEILGATGFSTEIRNVALRHGKFERSTGDSSGKYIPSIPHCNVQRKQPSYRGSLIIIGYNVHIKSLN